MTVDDGRLVGVDAGPGNPLTDGFICQKVKHHAQRVYAPERVLTPLVRTGPKGAGEFRAASWDEALDLVAERLRDAEARFGAESVVPYIYNSSAPAMQSLRRRPVLRALRRVARSTTRSARRRTARRGTRCSATCSRPTRATSCTRD